MRLLLIIPLFFIFHFSYSQEVKTWFPLKGHYSVTVRGGASQVTGSKTNFISPVINPAFQYHFIDRLSIVAESFIFLGRQSNSNDNFGSDLVIKNVAHYGLALRYYTHKNLVCGTPVLQSGVYMYDTEGKANLNWIVTPGWIYPLNKSEKLFAEIAGDFQMNRIVNGEPFFITAKVGLTYYF